MPSAFSHAVAAGSIAACYYRPEVPKSVWVLGAALAALPDLDVIGFGFGIRYEDLLGHRGLSHSVAFAAALALGTVMLGYRHGVPGLSPSSLGVFLFLAIASHGLLDGLTNGGLGVAFLAPFSGQRFFLPFRPIQVAPIGVAAFFSAQGWRALSSELVWVWAPSGLLAIGALALRALRPLDAMPR